LAASWITQDRYVEEHFVIFSDRDPTQERHHITVRLTLGDLDGFTMAGSGRLTATYQTLEEHVGALFRDVLGADVLPTVLDATVRGVVESDGPHAMCVHAVLLLVRVYTTQTWPPPADGEVHLGAAHVQASVPHRAAYIAYELLFYCTRRYNNESFRQLAALFFRFVAYAQCVRRDRMP